MEQKPRILTKKAYKGLNPCYLKFLTKLILSISTQLASLFLDFFFLLRNSVSSRELPDSIQIKVLHFIENNAIQKAGAAMFYSILYFSEFLSSHENIWSSQVNSGTQGKHALGKTMLKSVVFKGHLSKLYLLGALLTGM